MTVLSDYAEAIYREINGRSGFDIPGLEIDLGVNVNNFRRLAQSEFIVLARKGKPNRYRLIECSVAAFCESLGDSAIPAEDKNLIYVPRYTEPITNELFIQALQAISSETPAIISKFGSKQPKFNGEGLKKLSAIMLQWIERYESDPRAVADDTRWALFTLEGE